MSQSQQAKVTSLNIPKYPLISLIISYMKKLFMLVANTLDAIAAKFKTTYNAVNIIVYYCLVPLFWAIIIDFKTDRFAFSLAVLSF